jgi:hypothetical protein
MKIMVWTVVGCMSIVLHRSQSITQPTICQVMCGFAKNVRKNTWAMISYLSTLNIILHKFVEAEGHSCIANKNTESIPMDCMNWNSSVSVFYGSKVSSCCVAWVVWALLSSQTHPKLHGSFKTVLVSYMDPMDSISWNSPVSAFYWSILAIWYVTEQYWILLLSP